MYLKNVLVLIRCVSLFVVFTKQNVEILLLCFHLQFKIKLLIFDNKALSGLFVFQCFHMDSAEQNFIRLHVVGLVWTVVLAL